MSTDATSVPLTLESIRNRPVIEPEVLDDSELFWLEHQKWLEECGYMLRPRYRPGWVPSWQGSKKLWEDCEDGQYGRVRLAVPTHTYM